MSGEKILVVDDDSRIRDFLYDVLTEEGYEVTTAENGEMGIEFLKSRDFHVVLTDLKMPKVDGLQVIRESQKVNFQVVGILITGYGTIKSAVDAMKAGAYDYITKPFQIDEIKIVIERALERHKLKMENFSLRKQLKTKYRFENIVGDSDAIQEVFQLIEKVADSDSTILIRGDSGTGKELIARAIHFNSYRKEKPMIPVNCGAIPEDLLESELFGHVKGAFTGATSTRIGRFELAHNGTIFLDEIGDMSPSLQVKVLRVLQEQEFERVGGTNTVRVNVRVIAATNQDLEDAVKERKFREDLYYRLNVIPISVPPLRDRKSDIPLLAHHFIERFNREKKKKVEHLSSEIMDYFLHYDWPGNVRELENTIERLVILKGKGDILPKDLPEKIRSKGQYNVMRRIHIPDDGVCFKTAVNEFEKELILQALNKTDWVKNKAAKMLNLKRTTLVEKMKKTNIEQPEM
ncbi:MAG: sigma-54 dependent transcriptional regulator [Thermodesulfobacteriota bacterium]|nr:sigma-54 dependent transcriptional regulator [Thermodesulfobacteriota bacterium]